MDSDPIRPSHRPGKEKDWCHSTHDWCSSKANETWLKTGGAAHLLLDFTLPLREQRCWRDNKRPRTQAVLTPILHSVTPHATHAPYATSSLLLTSRLGGRRSVRGGGAVRLLICWVCVLGCRAWAAAGRVELDDCAIAVRWTGLERCTRVTGCCAHALQVACRSLGDCDKQRHLLCFPCTVWACETTSHSKGLVVLLSTV